MNKIFHKGYFSEMFRQLKVIGIVAAVILMATNFTTLVSSLITIATNDGTLSNRIPGGLELSAPMMVYVYLAGLVFSFVVFNWLNRRSYSDFYHALPVTRKQIYFSSFLAIMLWMAVGLTAYFIVHSLIYLVLDLPFNYLLFFCVYVNMLIGALEVVGAISLACAISGTRFVNIFAGIVILFLPRFLLMVMSVFIESDAPYMLSNIASNSLFFDPSYNIIATPYGSIIQMMGGGEYTVNYAKIPAMLWSLGWSITLIFLGGVAFNKRSSETAGIPTKSKIFQAVVRTAIGLPLLLILMFLIVREDATIVSGVFLVLFSFIFYCLYELISTKSPKKMAKSMPLFFICIGVSLLYLVVPKLIIKAESIVKVDENHTKGFYLLNDENGLYTEFGLGTEQTYSNIVREGIRITDSEAISILSKAYDRNVNMLKKDVGYYGNGEYLTVKIVRSNGRDIVRNILFTNAEYSRLEELVNKNEKYYNAGIKFPSGKKYSYVSGLTKLEAKKLAAVYEEEFNSLDDAKKLQLKSSSYGYLYDYSIINEQFDRFSTTLQISGCIGARNYNEAYSINAYTPKTLRMYLEIINERNGQDGVKMLDELQKWFETGGNEEGSVYYLYIGGYTSMSYYESIYGYKCMNGDNPTVFPKDADPELYEIIKILANAELSNDPANALQISIYIEWYGDYKLADRGNKIFYLNISDSELERIYELNQIRIDEFEKGLIVYDESKR